MILHKKESLKSILSSNKGVHLTSYIVNNTDTAKIKEQLELTIAEAEEFLQPVLAKDDLIKFFSPIHNLTKDSHILNNLKGNIGLFRNKDAFRILTIPIDIDYQCHVADSFHVKPLIKWLQFDRDFILLGINKNMIQIYYGNQTTFQKVSSLYINNSREKESGLWLKDILELLSLKHSPKLFIAGETKLLEQYTKFIHYKNIVQAPLSSKFDEETLIDLCSTARNILKLEAKKSLEKALSEFHIAEKMNLTKKNIFQIAKAAIQGKIKKLIIAEGINVFGKIDKKTGGLAIHPFDLDHEDDDILDDLAQTVLLSGGEVYIAPKEKIPSERPIMAIIEESEHKNLKLTKNKDFIKSKESEIEL